MRKFASVDRVKMEKLMFKGMDENLHASGPCAKSQAKLKKHGFISCDQSMTSRIRRYQTRIIYQIKQRCLDQLDDDERSLDS